MVYGVIALVILHNATILHDHVLRYEACAAGVLDVTAALLGGGPKECLAPDHALRIRRVRRVC